MHVGGNSFNFGNFDAPHLVELRANLYLDIQAPKMFRDNDETEQNPIAASFCVLPRNLRKDIVVVFYMLVI